MDFEYYPEEMVGEWQTFESDRSPDDAVQDNWLLEDDTFILEE